MQKILALAAQWLDYLTTHVYDGNRDQALDTLKPLSDPPTLEHLHYFFDITVTGGTSSLKARKGQKGWSKKSAFNLIAHFSSMVSLRRQLHSPLTLTPSSS